MPGDQPNQNLYNEVSGLYRSQGSESQLELRVDIDGKRPMNKLSGDLYGIYGSTIIYRESFVVESVSLTITDTAVTVQGPGRYSRATKHPFLKVTIPRTRISQQMASATAQFLTDKGVPKAEYVCQFESKYFRSVQYEQDWVSDVATPVFTSYNTGSLPSGGLARNLSVADAYADCGIEMQTSGVWDKINASDCGPDLKWSDSELHASMVKHFSLWSNRPQWNVWLLVAQEYERGPDYLGIMFDQKGKQRQGCAVFHRGLGGTTPNKLRLQLFCYVHELGHCFNLQHSWKKNLAEPAAPNRPESLSWMNYPWYWPVGYPNSDGFAFWKQFAFQFDDLEVTHLRHAFRNSIIMGGNNFQVESAITDSLAFASPIVDNSGLKLELRAKNRFSLGEPIVVEIKLSLRDLREVQVHSHLHPNDGFVQIGILKPGGEIVVYEPLIEHCLAYDLIKLDGEKPSIYESAFLSYGKGGLYFDQPGSYQLRALYYSVDGSIVTSDTLKVRVSSPHNSTDEEVADLFLGAEQGTLLYLLGSDSEFLKKGNLAFDTVLDYYADHPLAVYAMLIKGFNAGRGFKTITEDKKLTFRQPIYGDAICNLSEVVDLSVKGRGVDNITLHNTMRRMAITQKASGELKDARETMDRMVDIFSKKSLKPHIMRFIEVSSRI